MGKVCDRLQVRYIPALIEDAAGAFLLAFAGLSSNPVVTAAFDLRKFAPRDLIFLINISNLDTSTTASFLERQFPLQFTRSTEPHLHHAADTITAVTLQLPHDSGRATWIASRSPGSKCASGSATSYGRCKSEHTTSSPDRRLLQP